MKENELFWTIIRKSFEKDYTDFLKLRAQARRAVKRFRPKTDRVKVPVDWVDLPVAGRYDYERDRIEINPRTRLPIKQVLQHEIAHRKIFKTYKTAKNVFMYNMLLEFADSDLSTWMNYYFDVYIRSQIVTIKKWYL